MPLTLNSFRSRVKSQAYTKEGMKMTRLTPILFVRVANMKNYRGVTKQDIPKGGGAWVDENKDAGEAYNFLPLKIEGDRCLGYVQIAGSIDRKNPTLHIENIIDCQTMINEDYVDNVHIVFCASNGSSIMRVVGFYRNATVCRYLEYVNVHGRNHLYHFDAMAEDAFCIPFRERYEDSRWEVPISGKWGYDFGFGRSNLCYFSEVYSNEKAMSYVLNMIDSIETYRGKNVLGR